MFPVVARKGMLLLNVSLMMWCALIAMKKVILVRSAISLRRLRLVGECLL